LGGQFQAGIGDVLDTFLYMLGVFPKLFDDFFTGGIDIRTVEDLYSPIVGLLFTPFLLILYFGFGIYVVAVDLAHIPTWTIGKIFNDQLPFGFIIVIITVITLFFVPQLANYLAVPFTVLTIASAVWFFSLFFTFGNIADTFNIIQFLIDIFKAFDNNIFLFFSFFALRVIFFWLYATVIFAVDLFLALLDIRRRLIIWRLRVNVGDIDETVEEFKSNFKDIDKRFKELEKKVKELEGLADKIEELEEGIEVLEPSSSYIGLLVDNNNEAPEGPIKKRKPKITEEVQDPTLLKEKHKKKSITRKHKEKDV